MGKSLVATHIDSWENGSQNWTPKFREEFKNRRGYDLMPYLPVMTGRIVGSREISERFLWDVRQTINELVLQNYAGQFREMAHRHGLRLSIEAYTNCPCDELAYGGYADEPMGEFWSWWFGTNKKYGFTFSCTEMASAAHVYGKKIVGAEAFTACDSERWLGHPGNIKDLGDFAFCEGINRFVFHRYAMQPWLNVKPGMSMGPWGLHYERTQTWWNMSKAWHEYLARCQYLLRQGLFVADVCYLGAEASPQSLIGQKRFLAKTPDPLDPNNPDYPRERIDYSFDVCSTEALLTRMSVKDGRLVLPDGMSYRLLVLPNVETMTPKLLDEDQGIGRGRGDGRRLAALEIAELERFPAVRRGSSSAGRADLGIGRSARSNSASGRLARVASSGPPRFRRSRESLQRPRNCWVGPMDMVSRGQSGRFRPAGQTLFPQDVLRRWRSEIRPVGDDGRQRVHRLDRRSSGGQRRHAHAAVHLRRGLRTETGPEPAWRSRPSTQPTIPRPPA